MRKSREEAAATRERIVDSAAREFRQNGIAGTALADLMQAAGLTHGGFYKHFESKDQLVGEAVKRSFEQKLGDMESSTEGGRPEDALSRLVTDYLSAKHRDRVGEACPLSSLGTDLRQADEHTCEISTEGIKRIMALVAKQIKDVPADAARKRAHAIVAAMVGGVVLSRITNNAHLSNTILKDTREFILKE
jgi:TetR/AcrR family transcriptional regulator, transcriptional repressor for nem operon